MKNQKYLIVSAVVLFHSISSFAQAKLSYPAILQSLTANKAHIVADVPQLDKLYAAPTLEAAGDIVKSITYPQIGTQARLATPGMTQMGLQALLKKRQLTIVITPGLLAEFIKTRAIEDLFSKPTSYQKTWAAIAAKSGLTDPRMDLHEYAYENAPIGELISAASIDDAKGNPLLKVIIFNTKLGSLESLGDNQSRAEIFNRRLAKYLQLTNDQNLVFVGYSRGTPLALEMVTQAKRLNLSYLPRVKALVSYAGVVMGSSLADVTADVNSENGRLFAAAKELSNSLQHSESALDRPLKFAENSAAIAKFVALFGLNSKPDLKSLMNSTRNGDFHETAELILGVINELDWMMVTNFNGHVDRLKTFINAILTAVEQLRTENVKAWWKQAELPKSIAYYSVSAVMVDQDHGGIEQKIYQAHEGYNDTLDDAGLLDNKRTYEKVTGFGMNDSQVAIHQSQFLPKVIAGLNAKNAGLNIQSLGILQTHHWGVSLRTVNEMSDGRTNPFPREQVLTALGMYLNQ